MSLITYGTSKSWDRCEDSSGVYFHTVFFLSYFYQVDTAHNVCSQILVLGSMAFASGVVLIVAVCVRSVHLRPCPRQRQLRPANHVPF